MIKPIQKNYLLNLCTIFLASGSIVYIKAVKPVILSFGSELPTLTQRIFGYYWLLSLPILIAVGLMSYHFINKEQTKTTKSFSESPQKLFNSKISFKLSLGLFIFMLFLVFVIYIGFYIVTIHSNVIVG